MGTFCVADWVTHGAADYRTAYRLIPIQPLKIRAGVLGSLLDCGVGVLGPPGLRGRVFGSPGAEGPGGAGCRGGGRRGGGGAGPGREIPPEKGGERGAARLGSAQHTAGRLAGPTHGPTTGRQRGAGAEPSAWPVSGAGGPRGGGAGGARRGEAGEGSERLSPAARPAAPARPCLGSWLRAGGLAAPKTGHRAPRPPALQPVLVSNPCLRSSSSRVREGVDEETSRGCLGRRQQGLVRPLQFRRDLGSLKSAS